MTAALKFVAVVTGLLLLAFVVHDVVSLGMGLSASASDAPKQFGDALADAVTWGIQFKQIAAFIFVVCFIASYVAKRPTIKD